MDSINVRCSCKPWSQTQGMAPTSYHSSTERQAPRKRLFLQSKHKRRPTNIINIARICTHLHAFAGICTLKIAEDPATDAVWFAQQMATPLETDVKSRQIKTVL